MLSVSLEEEIDIPTSLLDKMPFFLLIYNIIVH
jgi:hypothetical protein